MKKTTFKTAVILLSVFFIHCLFLSHQANATLFSTLKSGNWKDRSIWSLQRLPGSQDSVKISNGLTITIDTLNAYVFTIFIESNATLNGGTNTLTVNGNLTNNGYLNFQTATLNFNGQSTSIAAGNHLIGNLSINFYTYLTSNTPNLTISGNWTNGGTFIPNNNTVIFNGKTNQTISGMAQFHNFYNLTLNMAPGTSLAFTPSTATQNPYIAVSNNLSINSGILIIDPLAELRVTNTSTGAIQYKYGFGIQGKIKRSVNASGSYIFPLMNKSFTEYCTVSLNNVLGISNLLVNFNTTPPAAPALSKFCVPVNDQLNAGWWTVQPDLAPKGGVYDITLRESGHTNGLTIIDGYIVIKRPSSSVTPLPWVLEGYHYNGTQKDSAGVVTAVCSGLSNFGDFNIGKSVAPIPLNDMLVLINKSDAICSLSSTGSATANVLNGTAPFRYLWSTKPAQTTTTITNLPAGYDTVTVTDAYGCKASASTMINFKPAPGSDFASTQRTGNIVDFSAVNPLNKIGYTWDFGDNTSATGITSSHSYTAPGGYMVSLKVMDSSVVFCQGTTSKFITVGTGGCTTLAEFTFTQDSMAKTVSFFDKSIGKNLKYYWDFGNGSSSSQSNPYGYKYPVGGAYSVCLTVLDTVQNCQSITCHDIKANNLADCKTKFLFFTDSGFNKIQFDGRSLNTAGSYYWEFGNGDYSNDPNPLYTYPAAGYYNVCLTTHDSIIPGCQSQYCQNVHIGKGNCLAAFTALPNANSMTVNFKDASVGNISGWHWDFGDGHISNLQNPVYTFSNPGFYEVCLTDSGSQGCQNTSCSTIHVGNGECKTDFSVFANGTGLFAEFKDESFGMPVKWAWEFGDGQTDSTQHPFHTYLNNGIFTACLTTINAAGCINHNCQDITVGPIGTDCQADFEVFEKNKIAEFNNKSIGNATTYFWDFGDQNSSSNSSALKSPTHTYSTDGYYNVTLTIYNATSGCFNTTGKKITIGTLAADKDCEAKFSFIADPVSKTVRLKDESFGKPLSWSWVFGDSTAASVAQNPVHTFIYAGFKEVCLTIKSANGSTGTHCNEVNIGQTGLGADFSYKENKTFFFKNDAVYPISFYGSSYGKPSKWKWSFGDAAYDSLRIDVTHNYASTGSYNTCLTVTDPNSKLASNHCKVVKVGTVQGVKENTNNTPALDVYPNPLTNQGIVSYFIEQNTLVQLSLYDLQGRKLKTLAEGEQQGYVHQAIDISDLALAPGMYLIQLASKGTSYYKPVIISK